ncbi:MAG: hypothetical protein HXX20_00025 [Chloroflexi bacterium]|nr:hypothetical protein [Chloroflexota bacterium]
MIVAASKNVCDQLENIAKLEVAKSQIKDLEATLDALRQLKTYVSQLIQFYQLIQDRISESDRSSLEIQFDQILQDISFSHKSFADQRRQVKAIEQAKDRAKKLEERLNESWKRYFKTQTNPHFELLDLVQSLPEVREQKVGLNQLRAQLMQFRDALPRNPIQRANFDETLQHLANRLDNLNFSPEVKTFLSKVRSGTATLAELNNEVLEWCQQGERAKGFFIKFGN